MPVNELVLDRLIESFQVAIGLRVFRVIEEVNEAGFLAIIIEMFFEFTAVIGLDPYSGEWSYSNEVIKGIAAVSRRV